MRICYECGQQKRRRGFLNGKAEVGAAEEEILDVPTYLRFGKPKKGKSRDAYNLLEDEYNMEVAHVLKKSKLGVFDDACRDFAEQVINLDGVLAVGAKPYLGHVDIWTITQSYDYELEGKIINSLFTMMEKYDNLLFDFLILPDGKMPKDYIMIYEVNNANPISA